MVRFPVKGERTMEKRAMRWMVLGFMLGAATLPLMATTVRPEPTNGPVEMRVDDLKTPLGIDDPTPRLSWQLRDLARGAKQTAYEVLVATRAELLAAGKADVWDSGRVESGQSLNVRYAGPAVVPSTRYFWRVKVWDAAGKPYAESEIGW